MTSTRFDPAVVRRRGARTSTRVLAISFHRRHRQRWAVAVVGLVGAPLLLLLLLGIAPAILGMVGLLTS